MRTKACMILFLAIFFVGCAKVQVTRIQNDADYKEGIRFCRPYPYLLVTEEVTSTGRNLEGSIVYLPQRSEEYCISLISGLGSVESKFKLEHGWRLTDFGEVRDSKTPETIKAFSELLPEVTDVLMLPVRPEERKKEGEVLSPGLWKFEFNEQGFVEKLVSIIKFKPLQ